MKKSAYILIILSLGIILTSCREDTIYTYYYENRSGHDIVIEKYMGKKIEYIDIPSEEDYISIYILRPHPDRGPAPFEDSHKVHIVFDNERELIWYNRNHEGLYPGSGSYRQVNTGKYTRDMFFTFTPEMYDEAVPIEEVNE